MKDIAKKKKISIIIPVYNTEKYLRRCLDSIVKQTYKNIEPIVVNDASKGNCKEIVEEYQKEYKYIKYVEHKENKGLFHSRIDGAKEATGDYITFLDSDDYIQIDLYRSLMNNAEENNSDIVVANTIIEKANGERFIYNLFNCKHHFELNNEEILDGFFNQRGMSFDWHTVWNKIYKMDIWKKALPYYSKITKHLVMTEDLAFSTVLMYFAKKMTYIKNDGVYYCQNEEASTNSENANYTKFKKNIDDLHRVFSFVEEFLKEVSIYDKYESQFKDWKCLFKKTWEDAINYNGVLKDDEKEELLNEIEFLNKGKICNYNNLVYNYMTKYNDGLEKIKEQICDEKYKIISFDIFDTLVERPFYKPTDLFELLNKYYYEITDRKSFINIAKLRVEAEELTRIKIREKNPDFQDITLDEIYNTFEETYFIDHSVVEKLKKKEIELELRFCNKRNTGYELYTLAVNQNKRVIITSDMYLNKEIIEQILEKNNIKYDKLYLSSDIRKTKAELSLYNYIIEKEKVEANEILHIGNSWASDKDNAEKCGIETGWLPDGIAIYNDENYTGMLNRFFNINASQWYDNTATKYYVGIRTFIAVAIKKYFDNPFISFNLDTDFNNDPYFIGYYVLGMYMFATAKWLLDSGKKNNYNKMVFMARDGKMPMEAYKILKKLYKNAPEEDYLYISRKAIIAIILKSKVDFYKLADSINVVNQTKKELLRFLDNCLLIDDDKLEKLCEKENIDLNTKFDGISEYNSFIKLVLDNFYDEKLINKNQKVLKDYFSKMFEGNSAVFDIGYSGRPELYLSELIEKPIDTYFMNINNDESLRNEFIKDMNIYRFFGVRPSVTGCLYEMISSALAPSCIKYEMKDNKLKFVFEEEKYSYYEHLTIGLMQKASLEFISDMVDIFDEDIDILFFDKQDAAWLVLGLINSINDNDRRLFDGILFEDDLGAMHTVTLTSVVNRLRKEQNQKTIKELTEKIEDKAKENKFVYTVDLKEKRRVKRLVYYALLDRKVIKRRIKEVINNRIKKFKRK